MNIIERIKNILLSPKTEWDVINQEEETLNNIAVKYVLIIALIPSIATAIGYSNFTIEIMGQKISTNVSPISLFLKNYITSIISFYICTYVVDALASNFNSEKNINKSAQLVAYSFTASWIAGIFSLIPILSFLSIVGLYSIYLFYIGLPKLKKTPEDKILPYMLVSALVIIGINLAIGFALGKMIVF